MDPDTTQEGVPPERGSRNCFIITLILVGMTLFACIVTVILTLVVVRNYQGLPPGALEEPSAYVSLRVLSDGCTVERGEVQGTGEVRMLTWVIVPEGGTTPALERNAENESSYRYFQPGIYRVSLKAWVEDGYEIISDEVTVNCQ